MENPLLEYIKYRTVEIESDIREIVLHCDTEYFAEGSF